jgi:FeS assembly SUF system protein
MWDAFNIFGRKKSEPVEEDIVAVKSESELLKQPQSSMETQDPVYAPSPWDEHQALDGDVPETALDGVVARAGNPLQPGTELASKEEIGEALKTVYDPEIPVDIYELGLIYEINIEINGDIKLVMTLTAPGCPVAGILPQQVADAAASVEGAGEIEVTLVWDPPWDQEKMSEDAKLALGMY